MTKIAALFLIFCMSGPVWAADLLQVLKDAESYNPRLKSVRFQEQAATENITAQKSRYLPDVSAAAIASTGNPGSFALYDVDSDISSAQRLGAGGALVLKQDIWDFGRTSNAVQTAEGERELQKKQLPVFRIDVDLAVLRTYLGCTFFRSRLEDAKFMADQARLLAKETDRFVRSGQRSVIERYLVDAEAKEAETRIAEYSERVTAIEQRLAIETGRSPNQKIECTDFTSIATALAALEKHSNGSPLIEVEEARVQIAQSKLGQSRAEARPTLFGMVTGGYFDNDHLKDKFNYSAGVGIKLPLFEGFRLDSSVRQSEAELNAEKANLESSRLGIQRANSQYDEQIQSLKVRLDFLEQERKLAKQVFLLAKKRYLSLQGTMIDLRESIRNLNRVVLSTDETNRDLDLARGERSLINGASRD